MIDGRLHNTHTHKWSNTSGVIRVKRPKVLYEWCGKSRFSKIVVKKFLSGVVVLKDLNWCQFININLLLLLYIYIYYRTNKKIYITELGEKGLAKFEI